MLERKKQKLSDAWARERRPGLREYLKVPDLRAGGMTDEV
jgi:hypothetical protein